MNTKQIEQTPLLELDLLKTLVAIADTGNFSAAAESVFRTPSAVSMQVKRLEELVGKPLFNRDSRSVTPTHDGEVLLKHGRRLLALNREIVAQFIAPEMQGLVRLGSPNDVAEQQLPNVLRRFNETHCCVTVDVVVDDSTNLKQKLKNGELDLCLHSTTEKAAKTNNEEIVYTEPFVWAGARNGIAWESNPLPISVWEEGCTWRNAAVDSLKKRKRSYRIAFMSAHISGQRAAVLADLAVAPMPLSSCKDGIVALGEEHGLPSMNSCSLGLSLNPNPSEAVKAAADHIRASFHSIHTR